ncbi:MAG: lytic transglycosylase domain-containing protein [Acidimicrobiales bacterium]|nr:lytic transglycosylase domain-containing protein [Acidimicrobiales bacterium]
MHKQFLGFLCAVAVVAGACSSGGDDSPKRAASTTRKTTTTTTVATTTTTAVAAVAAAAPRTFSNATADDPALAAADIAAAEVATLDAATSPAELNNAAVALQLAYRRISLRDVSVEQAIAAAIPSNLVIPRDVLVQAMAFNVAAGRHLIALGGKSAPKDAPPAEWKIIAPVPSDELIAHYKTASLETKVPWPILAAVNFVETRLGRVAGVSSAGAQGPMQFLPSTWAAYGKGDINSVKDSIAAAARYLQLNGAPERMDDALWRYNHSDHYVEAIKAYANRISLDVNSFRGYYNWQVTYRTKAGLLILPVGWPTVPAMNAGLSLV